MKRNTKIVIFLIIITQSSTLEISNGRNETISDLKNQSHMESKFVPYDPSKNKLKLLKILLYNITNGSINILIISFATIQKRKIKCNLT